MIGKYSRVLRIILGNSLSYIANYRADFALSLLIGVFWSFHSFVVLQIIFLHTSAVHGWTKTDAYLAFITFAAVTGMAQALSHYAGQLEQNIRQGRLDMVLVKPIDAQFMSVFGQFGLNGLVWNLCYILPFFFFLRGSGVGISFIGAVEYLALILPAVTIWLSLRVIFMTMNFWRQRLDNLAMLLDYLGQFSIFPTTVFPKALHYLFYTFLPLAFVALVPVEALRGTLTWPLAVGSWAAAAFTAAMARLLWTVAIKNYSSASS